MFDIGFIEIMIVSMVALIVIGPERLPHVARTTGHLLGRLRRYVSSVKNDIQNEIRLEELKKMNQSIKESTDAIENSVRQEIDQLKSITETNHAATSAPAGDSSGSESQSDRVVSPTVSPIQTAEPPPQSKNENK